LRACGYRDAGEVNGEGLDFTWRAGKPVPPQVTIDHVLAGERLGVADYGTEDLPGSDHKAVWAEVFQR
jgi:endonuclease/exonuclease/phosphatase family metal-dependent hydrolase